MKTRLSLLLVALLNLPAHAQTPSPASTASGAAEPSLGKLFLSPEKRQSLERQRRLNIHEGGNMDMDTLQLNGVVQRSSGRHSVWINQRMRSDGDKDIGVQISPRNPAKTAIEVEAGKPLQLQVGESINRGTQERKDVVSPNAIRPKGNDKR